MDMYEMLSFNGSMGERVDPLDLKSCVERRVSSNLTGATT